MFVVQTNIVGNTNYVKGIIGGCVNKGNDPIQGARTDGEELGVVDGLVQLSFLIQAILSRVAASYELTAVQMRLLGILRGREPAMLELARFLNLDKSSVSGLIDRAERRGLVLRTSTTTDGRVVRVTLTPAGKDLAEAGTKDVARRINALVASLTAPNRSLLAALARQIILDDADTHGIDLSVDGARTGDPS